MTGKFNIAFFLFSILYSFPIITHAQRGSIKTVVIDPGHGGFDSGAKGLFSYEKDVSLSVALKFGKALQKEYPELKIVYTRTADIMAGNRSTRDEGLRYRADLANSSGGDLFISFHCNATGRKAGGWYTKVISGYDERTKKIKVKRKWVTRTYKVPIYEDVWVENKTIGTETYIWAVSKSDEKTGSMLNNVENDEEHYGEEADENSTLKLPDINDPVQRARMNTYTQRYFKKSLSLAETIEEEFSRTGRFSRGVKQRNNKGIWVLQATGMPSILIEMGFISNKDEELYLNSTNGQEEIIHNVLTAFRAYKTRSDSKIVPKNQDSIVTPSTPERKGF